jgi:hypothetical protein
MQRLHPIKGPSSGAIVGSVKRSPSGVTPTVEACTRRFLTSAWPRFTTSTPPTGGGVLSLVLWSVQLGIRRVCSRVFPFCGRAYFLGIRWQGRSRQRSDGPEGPKAGRALFDFADGGIAAGEPIDCPSPAAAIQRTWENRARHP